MKMNMISYLNFTFKELWDKFGDIIIERNMIIIFGILVELPMSIS